MRNDFLGNPLLVTLPHPICDNPSLSWTPGGCFGGAWYDPQYSWYYLGCDYGYTLFLGLCYADSVRATCPDGYYSSGLFCSLENPPLMTGSDLTPIKNIYSVGLGAPPGCDSGYEEYLRLCYPQCAPGTFCKHFISRDIHTVGYDGIGPVCWDTCPPGFQRCGLGIVT